jgi:hypothetical protein
MCAALPLQGLEGVVYDFSAVSPAPVPSVDLRHMGPMKLSRFWSAVHDALLYADPRAATGGRVSLLGWLAAALRWTITTYTSKMHLILPCWNLWCGSCTAWLPVGRSQCQLQVRLARWHGDCTAVIHCVNVPFSPCAASATPASDESLPFWPVWECAGCRQACIHDGPLPDRPHTGQRCCKGCGCRPQQQHRARQHSR